MKKEERELQTQEVEPSYRPLTEEERREFKRRLLAAREKQQAPPEPRKLPRYPTEGWFDEK